MMTSIKSIYTYINLPDTEVDDKWIEEYASQGVQLIGVRDSFEQKVCIMNVSNHRASLPSDLRLIEAVSYQYEPATQEQVTKLTESLSNNTTVTVEDDGTQTVTNTLTTMFTTPGEVTSNQEHVLRIQHQGMINNYQLWMDSDIYKGTFKLMKLANRAFSQNYHCTNCPNFDCTSEHTYSITPSGSFQTSLQDGNVCIAYLAQPTNCDGDWLIPDDPDYKSALAAYVQMRYANEKMWLHEENMFRLYYQFKSEWEKLSAKVRGKFIMKSIDEEGLVAAHKPLTNVIRGPQVFDNE